MSGSDLEMVGEARDGAELIEILSLIDPAADMAIVDITMRDIGGIKATATIKHFYPVIKVLIISTHREIQYVQEALSSGADGYLLKEYLDAELFPAIEHIRQSGVYLSNLLNETE